MIPNFSDHAANERTFLAWVRSAMALVGFGIAIGHLSDKPASPTLAVVLIGVGVLVVAIAFVRMRVMMRKIGATVSEDYDSGMHGSLLTVGMIGMVVLVIVFGLHIV